MSWMTQDWPKRPASRNAIYPTLKTIALDARRCRWRPTRSWARRLQPGTPLAIAGVLLPPKVYPWLPDIASQFPSSAPSASVATIPPGRTDVIRLRKSTSRSTALPVRATSPTRKPSSSHPALVTDEGPLRTASVGIPTRDSPRNSPGETKGQTTTTWTGLHLSQFLSDVLGD